MKKTLLKRSFSLVLCVVMLFSCWVFTVPSANAATGPSDKYGNQSITTGKSSSEPTSDNKGRYRIRLLVYEENTFDKSVHDNQTYPNSTKGGLTYSTSSSVTSTSGGNRSEGKAAFNNYTEDKNASGTKNSSGNVSNYDYWNEYARITYKNLNGTGSTGYAWVSLGDRDGDGRENIISSWGSDYGYFPNQDGFMINGFPTALYARYVEWGAAKTVFVQNKGGFRIWLQIATWNSSSSSWEWPQGTCPSSDSSLDNKYRGGIYEGSQVINNTGNGDIIEVSGNVETTYYPQASSTKYANNGNGVTAVTTAPAISYATGTISCPKTSTAALTASNQSELTFTSPKDQYGVEMAANITTSLSRDDKSATDFTQSGKTTKAKFSANIDGTTSFQYVTPTVTWPQKTGTTLESTVTSDNRLKVYDAQYTVKFKDASGNTIQNGTSGDLTRTVYYGSNASAPAAYTYAKNYDNNKHYTFKAWDPLNTNVTSDRDCWPTYNEIAHTMVNDDTLPGYQEATCLAAGTQTRKCSGCDWTDSVPIDKLDHVFNAVTVFNNQGKDNGAPATVSMQCSLCHKYCKASYDPVSHKYDPAEKNPELTDNAVSNEEAQVPTPTVNAETFVTNDGNTIEYNKRGASLKLENPGFEVVENDLTTTLTNNTQVLRFIAAINIPEDGMEINPAAANEDSIDTAILDFGFIYTQREGYKKSVNPNVSDSDWKNILQLENTADSANTRVYKMSVAAQNTGKSFDNWSGCTLRDTEQGKSKFLTFNLLINVNAKNWGCDYIARSYITYKYRGITYTIYDNGSSLEEAYELQGYDTGNLTNYCYSYNNVAWVALQGLTNSSGSESPYSLSYLRTKIWDSRNYWDTSNVMGGYCDYIEDTYGIVIDDTLLDEVYDEAVARANG